MLDYVVVLQKLTGSRIRFARKSTENPLSPLTSKQIKQILLNVTQLTFARIFVNRGIGFIRFCILNKKTYNKRVPFREQANATHCVITCSCFSSRL